jgi:hypothetical protein
MYRGSYSPISELVATGARVLVLRGDASEGWAVYSEDNKGTGLQVSPLFHKDWGDTRTACIEACERAYGLKPLIKRT